MSLKDRPGLQVVAVIPARYASTRFPGKPLAEIEGRPMIQWVHERASKAASVSRTIVATDDRRIFEAVDSFGGEAMMTDPSLPSGTDRVAAVADEVPADIYVNVQGDEPLIEPGAIDAAVELVASGRFPIGTLRSALRGSEELGNPSVVKVLTDRDGRAIYFSRFPIPYSRGNLPEAGEPAASSRHIGIYVYSKEALSRFRALEPTAAERAESLEQLRALEHGLPIGVAETRHEHFGVDTPGDLSRLRDFLKARRGKDG